MYSILYVRIWAQRDLKFCSKLCIEYGMGMKSVFQFLNSGQWFSADMILPLATFGNV